MKRGSRSLLKPVLGFALGMVLLAGVTSLVHAAPKRGGTLVLAIPGDPGHFNYLLRPGTPLSMVVTGNVYNKLVSLDFDVKPVPELAESWEVTPDGKKYTFHLRKNAFWHDGTPFTSEDVKFTFDKLMKFYPRAKVFWNPVADRVETPDKYTVIVYLKKPFAPLLVTMGVPFGGPAIYPKKHWQNCIKDRTAFLKCPASLKPIGTGPFRFVEYKRGSHVTLVRWEKYWDPPKPYADRLIGRFIKSANTRVAALEKGEVDFVQMYSLPWEQVPRLRKNPKIVVLNKGGEALGSQQYILFNLRRKYLADRRVRKAIAYAIDKDQISKLVTGGLARVSNSIVHYGKKSFFKPSFARYKHNLAKAKKLMAEAGYKGGKRLRLTITWADNRPYEGVIAEVLRQQLKPIGIDVKLESFDRPSTLAKVFRKHDFDLMMQNLTTGPDPKISVTRLYDKNNIGEAVFNNAMAYVNPKVQKLLDAEWQQSDPKKRAEMWKRIADLVADDAPLIPLFYIPMVNTHTAKWKNVVTTSYGLYQSRAEAYLAK